MGGVGELSRLRSSAQGSYCFLCRTANMGEKMGKKRKEGPKKSPSRTPPNAATQRAEGSEPKDPVWRENQCPDTGNTAAHTALYLHTWQIISVTSDHNRSLEWFLSRQSYVGRHMHTTEAGNRWLHWPRWTASDVPGSPLKNQVQG